MNKRCSLMWPFLMLSLASCGGEADPPTAPTGATATATATPLPATPTPTALPTPTATPALTCSLTLSDATFDPPRVACPAGTTTQTVRLVFDLSAGGQLPITLNKVSTANVTCRVNLGTCRWPEGSLAFSPSVIPAGTRAQIVATQQFSCGSDGSGPAGELIIGALYVNTSCGPAREIKVTNTLSLG